MCGRYTLAAGSTELVEAFDVPVPAFAMPARYNIAPGQDPPIVAEDRHGRRAGLLRWGLIPSWVEEPGRPLINARSESVSSRPSFRESFERRRCLVPADGFYEWKREGGGKQPYWIHPPEGGLLSFAGIWDTWTRRGAEPLATFAILTRSASDDVRSVHDRMPVVIVEADRDAWLDRRLDVGAATELIRAAPTPDLSCRRVSSRVNKPSEDDPGLIEPVDG